MEERFQVVVFSSNKKGDVVEAEVISQMTTCNVLWR
jgi:hypothetical protein